MRRAAGWWYRSHTQLWAGFSAWLLNAKDQEWQAKLVSKTADVDMVETAAYAMATGDVSAVAHHWMQRQLSNTPQLALGWRKLGSTPLALGRSHLLRTPMHPCLPYASS